jgi:uncharacterized protein (DUF305 family)
MTKISIYLAGSFMVITLIVGMAIGYYLTPQYQLSMYDKVDMDLGEADKWLDLRYVNSMISHHRGAMLLAEQATKSERMEIKNLAEDILKAEPKAIEELYKWKKDWYKDFKKVIDPKVSNLGNYDKNFDLRFLNALISHHENGIVMTKSARTKTTRVEVLDNADGVEAFLSGGIDMLKGWRNSWYSI